MAKIKLSDEAQKNLLNRVWQDYQWGKTEMETLSSDWQDWRDQYQSEWSELAKVEDDEELKQWLFVPTTRTHVQRLEGTLLQHFFPMPGTNKLGKLVPTRGAEPIIVKILDQVLHGKIDIEMNTREAYAGSARAALVEGSGVLKGWWEKKRGVNVPHLAWIPNEDVIWDPYATTSEDIQWFIHFRWMDEEELWQRQASGAYENVEKVTAGGDEARESEWRKDIGGGQNRKWWLYRIMEFWGPQQMLDQETLNTMHLDGKHEPARDILATVYKNTVVLRIEDNPFAKMGTNPTPYEKLPFWIGRTEYEPGGTRGASAVAKMRDSQREVNLLHNQRRQAVDMEMTGKVIYDATRLMNPKDLWRARYGGAVPVQGPINDLVEWFKPQTSTQSMVQEQMMMEEQIRDLSGVSNIHMGRGETNVDTATGMTLLTTQGNATQDVMIATFAETAVIPVIRFFANCCKKYLSNKEIEQIIGAQEPLPDNFGFGNHDYSVEIEAGASATSKAVQLRSIQSAVQGMAQLANALPAETQSAIAAVMPEYMRLLGVPEAQEVYAAALEAMKNQAQAPAATQTPGAGNPQNEIAMAQQGRGPTPEETPAMRQPYRGMMGGGR